MNIVLVTVDSLRSDVLSDDNRSSGSLPALDSFRAESTVCSQAFTSAPYTADSFRAILSGTYPWEFGTTPETFEAERPHVVEPLAEAGYETAGFYTNPYLGPSFDYDRGWDHYTEGDTTDEGVVQQIRDFVVENIDPESNLFALIRQLHRTVGERFGVELEGKPYPSGDEVVDSFLNWLDQTDDRPVFGWLHFMDVHSPFYPHDGTPSEGISKKLALQTFYSVNKRPTETTDEELELLWKLYQGEVQAFDEFFGSLIDGIDKRLDPEETMILFTSDHGEAFDEHGFCFHPKELYDELVDIPLMIRSPTLDKSRITTPVSTVDIVPTILQHARIDRADEYTGLPISELAGRAGPRHVFSHAFEPDKMKAMATDGKWKLIRSKQEQRQELYDRERDPTESTDRLESDPSVATDLQEVLDDHLAGMDTDYGAKSGSPEVSQEVQQRLEELGYHD